MLVGLCKLGWDAQPEAIQADFVTGRLAFGGSHMPCCCCCARLCRLANLGKRADEERWGIEAFEERRDTHLFTRRHDAAAAPAAVPAAAPSLLPVLP